MRRFFLFGLLALLVGMAGATDSETRFPRPEGLEPDIAFWTRIYTEVETGGGLIHDARNLGVVYKVVALDKHTPRRKRNRQVGAIKKRYAGILEKLGSGKRKGLTAEEQRVLSLWPADVSNKELNAASRRVRFQLGQADKFREGLVRSGIYLPYIRKVLADQGLPPELAALPHVESSFNPAAWSKVGAAGMWQFTRSTGRRFMRIDHVVDERMDPYLSTVAAARLLEYNHTTLGSWPLAITAYNHGVAGMRRAIRQQKTDEVETILRHYKGRAFGFASRNFYVAFLAAVQVDADPEKYFGPITLATPPDTVTVKLPDFLSVDAARQNFGIDRQSLQILNPALMPSVWIGNKYIPKGYGLRLPGNGLRADPDALLAAIDPLQFHDRQKPDVYHKVRRGDTLSEIATEYGVSLTQLVQINGLRSRHMIRAGQVLRLPVPAMANAISADSTSLVAAAQPPSRSSEPAAQPVNGSATATIEVAEAEAIATDRGIPGELTVDHTPLLLALVAEWPETEEVFDTNALETTQQVLAADPSDYTIADDHSIEVQAMETLGHYADWLQIRTQRLRDLNGMAFDDPVFFGQRIRLDLSFVDRGTFERRRLAYHKDLQEAFFARFQIRDAQTHIIRRGESVWLLTQRRYKVPVWLLRQYNPDLDLERVRPGTPVQFPLLLAVADGDVPSI